MKIGPYEYQVTVVDPHDGADSFDPDRWGDVRHDLLLIRLNKNAHETVKLTTLMHEVLHGLFFTTGTKVPEEIITELAPILVMVLEDNEIDLSPWRKLIEEAQDGDRT